MAGLRDSCGIKVIERKGTVTDESVKWTDENVLPSRPQAVLLVETIGFTPIGSIFSYFS
jgi:hypothetical protein